MEQLAANGITAIILFIQNHGALCLLIGLVVTVIVAVKIGIEESNC